MNPLNWDILDACLEVCFYGLDLRLWRHHSKFQPIRDQHLNISGPMRVDQSDGPGLPGLLPGAGPDGDDGPQVCPLHPVQVSPLQGGRVHSQDQCQV